ncbi:hypothetical protein AHF37_01712 [Paragonimus kellicotti]|nr:hypothetical protein AHF37_01712 [Paragonimus kellicotti]
MDYDKSELEGITVILPVASLRSVQKPQTGQKRPARDEDGSPDSGPAKSVLTEEKRIRKFICRYCNKAFSLMNVLKVHERIHTGEKPYICDICDKAFNQSGSLNRHKNTHLKRSSDNRSYSCRYCPRQFLHSSQLQDHEASEHGACAKVATTPMLDSSVPNLYDSKSRSTGFCEMNAVSSPMRIRGFTGADSGLSLTDEIPTTLPNLSAVTNMFSKFDTNSIGYPPLSVALSLFNSQTDAYSLSNAENSALKVSDKQYPTVNRYSDSRTENHSPDKCVPRTIEFGKHMIQQMTHDDCLQNGFFDTPVVANTTIILYNALHFSGLPFGSHCPDALSNAKSSNPLGSPATNQTRPKELANPMEELLLNALQNPNKLTFPSLPTPYTPITSTSPDPVLSQDPSTATLFPGAAAAATLAALGQLLFPNSSSNTNPLNNPSLLANALANQEILVDPKFLVQQHLLSPNAVNFENAPFIQLIKSATGLNSSFDCKVPLLKNAACSSEQETHLGSHEEQGLNLAVGDKNRNQAPNGKATCPLNLPVISRLPMSSMDVHSGAWIGAQNVLDKSVFPADQLTRLSHKNGDKTDDASDTVRKVVRKPDQPTAMRSCLQETDTHSLNSFSPRNLSIVMNTYGFEGDTFSDPDGSSTTGSNPGSSIKKSNADCSPTSNRLRQCNVCEKTFNCSSALHIHYRKHSGERPFVCKHCGNAFSQNGTLKRHLQTCKTALSGDDQHSELEKDNCGTSGRNYLTQSPEATECEVPAQSAKLVDLKVSNDVDFTVQPVRNFSCIMVPVETEEEGSSSAVMLTEDVEIFNKAPAAENPAIRQTSKCPQSKFVSRSSQTHTSELTDPVVCSGFEKFPTGKSTEEQ